MSEIDVIDNNDIDIFEENEQLMDDDGNRFGILSITCGSLYESMLNISTAAANILDDINMLSDKTMSKENTSTLINTIKDMSLVILQLSEKEADTIYEECYDLYSDYLEEE